MSSFIKICQRRKDIRVSTEELTLLTNGICLELQNLSRICLTMETQNDVEYATFRRSRGIHRISVSVAKQQ
jgi:hypothetical protein